MTKAQAKKGKSTASDKKIPVPLDMTDEAREIIKAQGVEYFNQMMYAQKNGLALEHVMDVEGIAALKKVLNVSGNVGLNFNRAGGDYAMRIGDKVEGASAPRKANVIPHLVDEENPRGIDLYSLLLKKRILLVEGGVDGQMASIVCASLMYLSAMGKDGKWIEKNDDGRPAEEVPPITMYINSGGGSVLAGLAIYDTMRAIDAEIITIGVGMQASMGSVLLAAGDKRKMTRNSWLMVHQGSTGFEGQPTDAAIGLDLMSRLGDRCNQVYVDHLGLTREYWKIVLNRDTWWTAEQAKEIGYIDEIVAESGNEKKKARYAGDSLATEFLKAKRRGVDNMTAEDICAVINSDGIDSGDGDWAKLRPELATRLAGFPQYWTDGRQREFAEKNGIKFTQDTTREQLTKALNKFLKVKSKCAPANDDNAPAAKPKANQPPGQVA